MNLYEAWEIYTAIFMINLLISFAKSLFFLFAIWHDCDRQLDLIE